MGRSIHFLHLKIKKLRFLQNDKRTVKYQIVINCGHTYLKLKQKKRSEDRFPFIIYSVQFSLQTN